VNGDVHMTLTIVCADLQKKGLNTSHKILMGVKLFLSALFTYISGVDEFGSERSANTADEEF